MLDYSVMDETVEKLCDSLINNSHEWVFETFTFYSIKCKPKIEYWSAIADKSITQVYFGGSRETVFSEKQGEKIYLAYVLAKNKQASLKQQQIIQSFKIKEQKEDILETNTIIHTNKVTKKSFWDRFI
jgi:hypothetical protein